MSYPEQLSFRIDDDFFNEQALRKIRGNDIRGAYRFLEKSLKLPVDDEKKFLIFMRLMNGSARTLSDGTLEINNEDNSLLNSEHPIFEQTERMREQIETQNQQISELTAMLLDYASRLQFIADTLPESKLTELAQGYEKENIDDDNHKWLFEDFTDRIRRPNTSVFYREPAENIASDMLTDFLKQSRLPEEIQYGWLEPDGTFHPVEFARHYTFARDYLKKHYPDLDMVTRISHPDTYMQKTLHWVLLHSPHMGIPRYDLEPSQKLTKKQQEYLYDLYTKIGETELANAVYEQEE